MRHVVKMTFAPFADNRKPQTLISPQKLKLSTLSFQFSVHKPSKHMKKELEFVFPKNYADLFIVPCFFQSPLDLTDITPKTARIRDVFLEAAYSLLQHLSKGLAGSFIDLTDPCSGYPVNSPRGLSLYPDVDGSSSLLKYATIQAGCCRVLTHPEWGCRNYPVTYFTDACPSAVQGLIEEWCRNYEILIE